ncbi:hypothetical protein HanXRQr2_Chr10g0454161 [Helianthus annuus]|uniref:Uncharacterized protein n=1 Tax=Helianthus annuus TaxID=4232 RepID=A0A9K3HZN9_HELAN|nr:hypothetical protein HanXRQr2_Chr10g0454161 [Helianthus annuus]KAJ0884821.1 hypothetical protein HanPSC8_Chr10g0438291 [Helianthus annuus]
MSMTRGSSNGYKEGKHSVGACIAMNQRIESQGIDNGSFLYPRQVCVKDYTFGRVLWPDKRWLGQMWQID